MLFSLPHSEIWFNVLNQLSLYLVRECFPAPQGDTRGFGLFPLIEDLTPVKRAKLAAHLSSATWLASRDFHCFLVRSGRRRLFEFVFYRYEDMRENAEDFVGSYLRFLEVRSAATLYCMSEDRIVFPWSLIFLNYFIRMHSFI